MMKMRVLKSEMENRKVNWKVLSDYGFQQSQNMYVYHGKLSYDAFEIIVKIISEKEIISKVIDLENCCEYLPVDFVEATGEFVGKLKKEYEEKLEDVIEKCTVYEAFESEYAKQIIQYIKKIYQDDPEFLWKKYPRNAIFRHPENRKWYAALLAIPMSKLGIEKEGIIEIIDLRNTKEEIENIVDNQHIFPGYHMNKQHWFTIPLDGRVSFQKIIQYIDNSYSLK